MGGRWAAVLAAACVAAVIPTSAAFASNATLAGWVSTHTQALHLTGRLLGSAPQTKQLEVSVTLPLRDESAINGLIEQRTIMTPAEVAARFGPTSSSVGAVVSYLQSNGFAHISVASDHLLVTAYADVSTVDSAFHTAIDLFDQAGKTIYANVEPALVPTALSNDVAAIIGLSDIPIEVPNIEAAGSPDITGFTPKAVANAYDATSLPAAKGTTIAILDSSDETPIIGNLRYAEQQWGYPQVPVQVIYDGPKAGIVDNNPLTGNAEWDLDTQMSTEMAQDPKALLMYDVATYTDPEVARGINMFVEQDKAQNLSISLGECDYIAFLDGAMVTSDEEFAEGALQGQSSFASTGDNGYACPEVASTGVPEGPPGVSWPSDGEYTTATGGTTLLADSNGNVSEEIAWVGGGGGVSPWETAPPWTLQANPVGQTWQFTNQGGRSVPDISADADGNVSPVLIYTDDTKGTEPSGVGGTSVDAPLINGLWARINNVHHDMLGLAQYDLYALYNHYNPAEIIGAAVGDVYVPALNPVPVPGIRTIDIGTNGGCVAKAGYNFCTGLGAPLAAELAKEL